MLQLRQPIPQCCNFLPVLALGCDQHSRIAAAQPLPDRFRTESGEQRAKDAAMLERTQSGNIEFGNASRQDKDTISFDQVQLLEDIGEAIAEAIQVAISEISHRAIHPQPAESEVITPWAGSMANHGFVGDVQPFAVRETVQFAAHRLP